MLRLGSAQVAGRARVVAQRLGQTGFVDVTALCADVGPLASLDDLLDLPDATLEACLARTRGAAADLAAAEVTPCSPLTRPARIRDGGVITTHLGPAFTQMRDRLRQRGDAQALDAAEALDAMIATLPDRPFATGDRDPATLTGPGDVIVNPGGELDFELELAAVIRRTEDGTPRIFGYTLYNDWTLRDLQIEIWAARRSLYGGAKNFADSNTFGPLVLLAEDCPDPLALTLSAEVDDRRVSHGTLADAVRSFDAALDHLFRDAPIAGHEYYGSGTILGGCLFEQSLRLPRDPVVRLICPEIGVLENRARG